MQVVALSATFSMIGSTIHVVVQIITGMSEFINFHGIDKKD